MREGLQGRYVIVQTGQTKVGRVPARSRTRLPRPTTTVAVAGRKGLRVEDQPDYFYGKWVAEAYRMTKGDGTPRLEDVDAIINKPGAGRSRVRYTRLIVPMQLSLGQRVSARRVADRPRRSTCALVEAG